MSRAGCEKLSTDKAGGARAARPGLDQALAHLRKGETLIAWKLDRPGRSIRHLIETVGQLRQGGDLLHLDLGRVVAVRHQGHPRRRGPSGAAPGRGGRA
ncbi:recombinase family protein [Aquisphaera insulae]|uniref:recombinase family protein n=1 Tax=Aquisphaera insulae TaxID=2712864 RepID=UPI002030A32C|nr:recombinase family protein [Aquisphaera insulae]